MASQTSLLFAPSHGPKQTSTSADGRSRRVFHDVGRPIDREQNPPASPSPKRPVRPQLQRDANPRRVLVLPSLGTPCTTAPDRPAMLWAAAAGIVPRPARHQRPSTTNDGRYFAAGKTTGSTDHPLAYVTKTVSGRGHRFDVLRSGGHAAAQACSRWMSSLTRV